MPHKEVARMRRRLMKLIRLAEKAAEKGHEKQAERILEDWEKGKISYTEAYHILEKLLEV